MAAQQTERFSLYTWSLDQDEFTRSQMTTSHNQIETYGAKFFSGSANPPSPGTVIHVGSLYYQTTNQILYWYTGSYDYVTDIFTAGTWIALNEYGVIGDVQAITAGGTSSAGTSTRFARADHAHSLGAAVTPSAISTTAAVGTSTSVARADHVHVLASGSINSSALFASGVVNEASIDTGAVTSTKIKSSNSVDADRSITADHIKNNAIIERTINNSAVTKDKLAADSVVKSKVHTTLSGGPGVSYNGTDSGSGAIAYGTTAPAGVANNGDIYLRYI